MSSEQHLSDQAVAACADGALSRAALERARRHLAGCPECAHAVAVQREAVWALRAAPAPELPTSLLDRLRDVPSTTPITRVPAAFDDRGNAMFPTFGALGFAPATAGVGAAGGTDAPPPAARHRLRPLAMTAAAAALAGAVTAGAVMVADNASHPTPHRVPPASRMGPSAGSSLH